MIRTAAPLALLALGLAACSMQPIRQQEAHVVTQEMPYRAGTGVVIAATQAPAPITAAAGGTAQSASAPSVTASAAPAPYRLAIRMDNGSTVQYVDADTPMTPGSRVELGADHTIRQM